VFEFEGQAEVLVVHVFRATAFTGEPVETDEMAPAWFPAAAPPLESMWKDDAVWLPMLVAGACFRGTARFRGQEVLLSHDIVEVPPGSFDPSAVLVSATQGAISIVD